ncbi:hypothetical protein [Embleya sp. NPDC059237]|uniref:hypothetical protein n=1 Tax=Embleya sp. NPDC059237 TaxID=3346784 RepID=UPI0036BCB83A
MRSDDEQHQEQLPIEASEPGPAEEPGVRVTTRVTSRTLTLTCQMCGSAVWYRGSGTRPRYCGRTCRQRAYELRRHAAELGAAVPEPRVVQEVIERTEVVTRTRDLVRRERVEVPAAVDRVPSTAQEWQRMLGALAAQLADDRHQVHREHWKHRQLQDALRIAYAALDEAHPGGLDR